MEIVEFLREPERFATLGRAVPKGVLLHGPPDRQDAARQGRRRRVGRAFFSQSASSFVEMFVGLGSARIRKLFETAREHAPAIIFIDELDAVGMARSGTDFNREADQTLNQLLIELDGFADAAGVVVMASTNRLDHLDPALLRPGRFDRQVLVPPPDIGGRRAILAVHTRGQAARRRRRPRRDRTDDVRADRRRPREPLQRGRDPRGSRAPPEHPAARLRRRARAGRRRPAEPSRDQREGEADHRLPRGRARADVAPARHDARAQGHDHPARHGARLRMTLPDEERFLATREELCDEMTMSLLRSRRGDRSCSAGSRRARRRPRAGEQIARWMVCELGMGSIVESRTLLADDQSLSEETKRLRDAEQERLTNARLRGGDAPAGPASRDARPARRAAARGRVARPRRSSPRCSRTCKPERAHSDEVGRVLGVAASRDARREPAG